MKNTFTLLFLIVILISCSDKPGEKIITLHAKDFNLVNTPVYADVDIDFFAAGFEVCLYLGDEPIAGQVENITGDQKRVWWLANVSQGDSVTYRLVSERGCSDNRFAWSAVSETSSLLSLSEHPILRYEFLEVDPDHADTIHKPFHHVYDPYGRTLITNGHESDDSHNKGIFLGYNSIFINDDDQPLDLWHTGDEERIEHQEMLVEFTGPVMGGHIVRIFWKDKEGNPFLDERRELRVFKQSPGELLIDFQSILTTQDSIIRLEGDASNAGIRFVAHVSEWIESIHPMGQKEYLVENQSPGYHQQKLPWNAMTFSIDDQTYTIAILSHPMHPDTARMSEVGQGSLGEYFPAVITSDQELRMHYRFWIRAGTPPSAEEIEHRYRLFTSTPVINIEK